MYIYIYCIDFSYNYITCARTVPFFTYITYIHCIALYILMICIFVVTFWLAIPLTCAHIHKYII